MRRNFRITCDQNRTGRRPNLRISITAKMPPHPRRNILQLIRSKQYVRHCILGLRVVPARHPPTYFDVRLLMTNVDVWYCVASAKIDAIPGHASSAPPRYTKRDQYDSPMPESKSGTIAANVMMTSWRFLRKSDH